MGHISASQFNLAVCRLMGFEGLSPAESGKEITCRIVLDRMEKFSDFRYISARMLTAALEGEDLDALDYDYPPSPNQALIDIIDSPLDSLDKISIDSEVRALCELIGVEVSRQQTRFMFPVMSKWLDTFFQQEREKEQKEAEERRKLRHAAKEARRAARNAEPDSPLAKAAAEAEAAAAAAEEAAAAKSSGTEGSEGAGAARSRMYESLDKLKKELGEKHRYKGRTLNLRLLKGWDSNWSSIFMTINTLRNQLSVEDDGLTDMLRDVFVYEWFDKLPDDQRARFAPVENLDDLYNSLILTDVVLFPDGKSVVWYKMENTMLGSLYEGFGVDVDPPYQDGYAIGIKHIFVGSLKDHPSVKHYRSMLDSDALKEIASSAHYTPGDNISPFSLEETSRQMTFINNGYLIFDLDLLNDSGQSIEVLVREGELLGSDNIATRLRSLKEKDLSDFDSLSTDIINSIAEPLVEMKNEQEKRRRNRDPEYADYTFKDSMLPSDITVPRLLRNYKLNIERIIIDDENSLRFMIPTNLFAFSDKADDQFVEVTDTLGLVHADAIVVTLSVNGDGLDITSIDLADCVQIPYGSHKSAEIKAYASDIADSLMADINNALPEGWKESWQEANAKAAESRQTQAKEKNGLQRRSNGTAQRNKSKNKRKR